MCIRDSVYTEPEPVRRFCVSFSLSFSVLSQVRKGFRAKERLASFFRRSILWPDLSCLRITQSQMVETERRENDARRERQKETWKTGTKQRNTKETGTKTEIDLGLKAY